MVGEPKVLRTREEVAELDRSAWNVPPPRIGPVGPVREVWPVDERDETPASDDRPAAA
jgi:hypothetical protein